MPVSSAASHLNTMRAQGLRACISVSGSPVAGITDAVRSLTRRFSENGIEVIALKSGYEKVLASSHPTPKEGFQYLHLTPDSVNNEDVVVCTSRVNPGRDVENAADMTDSSKTYELNKVLDTLEYLRVGALVTIGGTTGLRNAHLLRELALSKTGERAFTGMVVHIPKTICNDIPGISSALGHESAVESASKVVNALVNRAKWTQTYYMLESIDRKSGWFTSRLKLSSLAAAALIPEDYSGRTAITLDEVAQDAYKVISDLRTSSKDHGVVLLAQGIWDMLPTEEKTVFYRDKNGVEKSTSLVFSREISSRVRGMYRRGFGDCLDFKWQILGDHIKSESSITSFDRQFAAKLAEGAFSLLAAGDGGTMVTLDGGTATKGIPISQLLERPGLTVMKREIDPNSDYYRMVKSTNKIFG